MYTNYESNNDTVPFLLVLQVIMLVESPDGSLALLGRGKRYTPNMYTCLSGFIDQCESVEEVGNPQQCIGLGFFGLECLGSRMCADL